MNGKVPNLSIPEALFHYPLLICDPEEGGKFGVGSNGTGAFELVEHEVGKRSLLVSRKSGYWGKGPYIDRLEIVDLGDDAAAQVSALASKQVDMIYMGSIASLPTVERLPHVQINTVVGGYTAVARVQPVKPFDDKRVRQAINYALDKKYLIETLLGGVHTRATGPIVSGSPFYTKDVERYDFNLDKARKLLDDAGLKPGVNGVRQTIDYDYLPGLPEAPIIQEYVKVALAKVGIEVNVRTSPDFPTWARRISSLQFDMASDNVWNWGDPVIGVHRTWLSSNIKPGVIWSNTQSYSNPKVDELLAAAGKEMNLTKRKAFYVDMQKRVVEDCPVAFLFEIGIASAYLTKVVDRPAGIWGPVDAYTEMSVTA